MKRKEKVGTSERRSDRLRRGEVLVHDLPSVNTEPRLQSVFEVAEEVVGEPAEGEVYGTPVPDPEPVVTGEVPVQSDEEEDRVESDPEAFTMPPSTRLKYSRFKGDGSQDVDDWFCEFESIAVANLEDFEAKQRIFQGLLKGEALKWYQDVPEATRNDWNQLTNLFVKTFREAGGEARALGRLSRMTMKSSESVRRYGQRVKALIQKLTTEIAPSVQVEWYVAGFPEEMGFQIRQSRPGTLREAMEAAQNYEDSAQSLRNALKRSERKSKKYLKKERRRRKYSDSSDSSSGSTTSVSQSQSSDTDTGAASGSGTGSRRAHHRSAKTEKGKGVVKVKFEEDETKKFIKSVQESLEAIKVNLAENRNPRRTVPTSRANIWCQRCGEHGHYPSECTKHFGKRIHYVNPEGEVYVTFPEGEEDDDLNPVFQIQSSYGRGKAPQQLVRANVVPRNVQVGISPGMIPHPKLYGFCFICGSPDHYANACPFKGQGQGAPLILPCQNCGEYGHNATQCQKSQQNRVIYKQVETPPRDQTGLNYGSKTGIENPDS
jgi:hypothetical protein